MTSTLQQKQKQVELLLPVGNKEMALAAIHNGADAIFLGMPGFNARGRSHDFDLQTLKEIIDLCHLYGVKVNIAFNIVIFEEELQVIIKLLEQILPLNPDALIVQDLGLVRLIRQLSPMQRIHGSTQMTVTNHEAIALLEDLQIQRFVLGRENSIEDMKKVRAKTDKELEVFVHGALCVSYSGQCFTSESIGGRSANRGQCAQSCRFSYELHVDGEKKDLGAKKYLVSPQDLCGIEDVPALVEAGVDCFKIEGRLKTPEYVATAARSYRKALINASQGNTPKSHLEEKKNMAISYSRGFFSGWMHGVNHQRLVPGLFSAHRGFEIGRISNVGQNWFIVDVDSPEFIEKLVPGDGLLWAQGASEEGGFIYGIKKMSPSTLKIELARDVQIKASMIGAIVYQNHDKELKKDIAQSVEDRTKKKRMDISVKITLEPDKPLLATITDGKFTVSGSTSNNAEVAKTRGVSDEQLTEEFSSLSGSIFRLEHMTIQRSDNTPLFIAHKEYKNLRQSLIQQLSELRQEVKSTQYNSANVYEWLEAKSATPKSHVENPDFNILLREKGQVQDVLESITTGHIPADSINSIILDFEFARDYEFSLNSLKQSGLRVGLATTRILKPTEYRNLKFLADLKPDIILVRNLGALHYLTKEYPGSFELRGDFSLNVANHLTAEYLISKGLSSLCLSYDLNHNQVSNILKSSWAPKLEVTIFQYMPSFHMEHCVFASCLSSGSSFKDCGKPCEKHQIKLKDQFNNWHHIKADPECRNTMFNAKSQSASRYVSEWTNLGLGSVRYEALKERGDELITKISAHLDFLYGKTTSDDLMKKIGSIESYGISEGQFGKDIEYQSRKK